MKTSRLFLLVIAAVLLAAAPARALYYWNPSGWDGTGDVPSGTWSTSDPNWYSGTGLHTNWDNAGVVACFCYTNVSLPNNSYTITVAPGAGIVVSDLRCVAGNPTITGDPLFLVNWPNTIDVFSGLTFTLNCGLTNWMPATNLVALQKWGPGTLALGATIRLQNETNRPGDIVVNGGTLRMTVSQVFGYTNNLVLANGDPEVFTDTPATLDTGGLNQNLGTLNLTGPNAAIARTIDFGSGTSALAFADSSAEPWLSTDGPDIFLHIVNYTAGVDSLRFGTSASGLTARQLQLMRFADFSNAVGQIDANGFVTPGGVPPEIVSDPHNTNVVQGQPASFTVVATGPGLSYQWRKDGVDIPAAGNPSAITATLVLNDAQTADVGGYSVVVSNAAATVPSRVAQLTVTSLATFGLHRGLVSYWPMETVTSGTTPDLSFGNNMTVVGSPATVSGKVGNTLQLSSSAYLKLLHTTTGSDQNNFPIWAAGKYTIAFWIKANPDTARRYIFCMASTSSATDQSLYMIENGITTGAGKLDLYIRVNTGGLYVNHVVSATTVFDNTWHHVALVDSLGTVQLYVDGVLDANSANLSYNYQAGRLTCNTTSIGALYRASTAGGWIAGGLIDEVATWERALSQAEVVELMNSGIPTPITAGPPAIDLPATTVANVGDSLRLTARVMGERPLPTTFTWSRNNVVDPTQTGATYFYPNLTTANSGDTFSVSATDSYGTANATNTLTVLADPPPALTNGVMSHWPLDTISSDGVNLSSPDVNFGDNMILQGFSGTDDVVYGMRGNALWFDTTKYAYRSGGLPIYNSTNYTVAMWVNLPSGGYDLGAAIFAEASTANGNALFELAAADPYLTVTVVNDSGSARLVSVPSTTTVVDDNWHFVVWTDANGQGKLYIDGTLDATDFSYRRDSSLTPNTTALGAELRAAVSSAKLYGTVDDVATWNRALSWTEIQDLMANGVPPPPPPAPPTIVTEPSDGPTNVYVGDSASFAVLAAGANPLSYQWRKDGDAISAAINSSATNTTLSLANLQVGDSGGYSVVVTNVSGSITSRIARLTVNAWALATTGDVARVAFGLAGSALQPGFERGSIQGWNSYSGGVRVMVDGVGSDAGKVQQRDRGAIIVNNPPALTQAANYNSFAFLSSTALGADLRIQLERLAPNTKFGVTLWAYDPLVSPRFSDWYDNTNTNNPVLLYGNGAPYWWPAAPRVDYQDTIRAYMTSTAEGTLTIDCINEGSLLGGPAASAYLNALQVVANPPPATYIANLVTTTNSSGAAVIHFDVVNQYIGQPYSLVQTANLAGGPWVPAESGTPILTYGQITTFEFPIQSGGQLFYRVASPLSP